MQSFVYLSSSDVHGLMLDCCAVAGASIKPAAFSFAYAAPEVLDVMRLHFNPSFDRSTLVNGAAADAWSIGIIMFEAIASELPFTTQYNLPEHVSTESERVWQAFAEIRQPQQLWVGFLIKHPHMAHNRRSAPRQHRQ